MRVRLFHIESCLFAVALAVVQMLCPFPVLAQTSPGTHIFNEAKGTFLYKTGLKDSLRSNVTETMVQAPRVASSIQIQIGPDAIIGNGTDSALVTATVRDASGNPVPDGATVSFVTSSGSFPGGRDSIDLGVVNGTVRVRLTSAVVSQQIVTAAVTALTIGAQGQKLSATGTLIFYPGAVSGSVSSAFTGSGASGAVVVAQSEARAEQGRDTTGTDGKYLVPIPAAGAYTHTITYRNRFGDNVQASFTSQLLIPSQGGIPPTGTLNVISGNVIDRTTGNPVRQSGMRVRLSQSGSLKTASGRSLPVFQTTDARGIFQFDSLNPGTYEIGVMEAGYAGTMVVNDTLPSCYLVDAALGVSPVPAFEVAKSSNKRIAEIGDAVAYMLEIKNASGTASLTGIKIVDDLPLGFAYVNGSSRHERLEIADPRGSHRLEWVLTDTLEPGKSVRLTYMTSVGSGAMEGDGVNHAYGVAVSLSGDSVQSPVASACVVVRPGIFTDHGLVIGKVFFEENENGIQEYGETGIAGVGLWMEDGTHIITGDDGKYSLPDVKPGQHVIRVDQRSLPAGSVLLEAGTESAGDAATRFIRLVNGGIARADFHVRPPQQAALELSVSPSASSGTLQVTFTVRRGPGPVPSAAVLVDTLPKGLSYEMGSLMLNGSTVAGVSGQARCLRVDLPVGLRPVDSVKVEIVRDSSFSKRVGTMRPRLVLSYPHRRDAVFGAVETFAVPATAIQMPPPIGKEAGVRSEPGAAVKPKGSG